MFIEELIIININSEIKDLVIDVKKTSNLKLPDSIIVATAMWLKIPFVTSDRQLKSITNLDLVYYEK